MVEEEVRSYLAVEELIIIVDGSTDAGHAFRFIFFTKRRVSSSYPMH